MGKDLYQLITSELKRNKNDKRIISDKRYHKYAGHKTLGIQAASRGDIFKNNKKRMTSKLSTEKFILRLGRLMEKVSLPSSVRDEKSLEYALLPHIKKFIQKRLTGNKRLDEVLYHHGRNKEEKKRWSKSKPLQTVELFGTNVSDMFITHQKIGAAVLEFKYVKLSRKGEGLTSSIQRAIGQSLIATIRHPFAVCVVVYEQQKKYLEVGVMRQLKNSLWEHHKIYLVIRKRAL